jgi:2-polyprenyl-6-hydroxyphenyl methylase/3-demethylubiquinone-9 3-methyltransferase
MRSSLGFLGFRHYNNKPLNSPVGITMHQSNIDQAEIDKFSRMASQWWDPTGDLKTLHAINPLRLNYINERAPLSGKKILDIGCGGGILAESMSKLGGLVTAIDMSQDAIQIAKLHQKESGTDVNYLISTAEQLADTHPGQFDIITCLEMLEHVPEPWKIIDACRVLLNPKGDVFYSTINRNVKSYLFAIIGAEYLLKMLPKNTHDFAKFIRPSELSEWSRKAGFKVQDITGMTYHLLTKEYQLTQDVSVNYLMHLTT